MIRFQGDSCGLSDFQSFRLFLQMQLPFFYSEQIAESGSTISLNEETSRHVVNVLRMRAGEQLHLTNGKGNLVTAEIVNNHKKHCEVVIKTVSVVPTPERQVIIAISLLKNASRFEWFLEKATEIGVNSIIPLLCERTERQHFRKDRMEGLLISAMLQSRQCWLPDLKEPMKFDSYINGPFKDSDLFIAHCEEDNNQPLHSCVRLSPHSHILIGPEGDFTRKEIEGALQCKFLPVSLGRTRLRSETAGVVAATLLLQ